MKSIYNAAEYPQGVPNPYTPAVHPFPSFQHGADYTRPVFGMPWVPQPFNVLSGLGQTQSGAGKTVAVAGLAFFGGLLFYHYLVLQKHQRPSFRNL